MISGGPFQPPQLWDSGKVGCGPHWKEEDLACVFLVTLCLAGKHTCLETKLILVSVSQALVVKSVLVHHGGVLTPSPSAWGLMLSFQRQCLLSGFFSDKDTHPGWEARNHHHLSSSVAVNITNRPELLRRA